MTNFKFCIRWSNASALAALAFASLSIVARAEVEAGKSQQSTNDKFKDIKMMRPQMGEQVQEAYYADGWSPHSLEPTFTDQEQGDEMVALANEPEAYVTRVVANNKTVQQVAPPPTEPTGKRDSIKRNPIQPDEYYSDDDVTEDENEPIRFGVNDYGSAAYAFERKDSKKQQHQPQNPLLSTGNKIQNLPNDLTPGQSGVDRSNSWLPKINNQPGSLMGEQLEQQQQQTISTQNQPQLSSISSGRHPLKAFGRTDAAIEYLRNVLQMKQAQQNLNNSTRPILPGVSPLPSTLNYTRTGNKQENLQRLSLFASKLSQLLNNVTASQAASIPASQKPTTASPIPLTDTKFKIEDAKQQQQQRLQTIASAIHQKPSLASDFHNYEYDQSQVDTPSGTPVGGDYIESQDDFLRGSSSFPQNGASFTEAVAVDQPASGSKDHLALSESSNYYQKYGPDTHKPVEAKYEHTGVQLPPLHATSSSYFRMAQPEPASPQQVHSSSRIPLNYQQSNVRQVIPYDAVENRKNQLHPTSLGNGTEYGKSKAPVASHEPSKRPLQSKIYAHEQSTQPIREQYLPKAPKIVSYNYFESPNDGGERDSLATNFKLGDALYSSSGSLEQMLSDSELEAIQNQFVSAEHPVVGVNNQHDYTDSASSSDSHLTSFLDSIKADPLRTEGSEKKPVSVTNHNSSTTIDFSRDLADLRQKGVLQAVQPLQLDSPSNAAVAALAKSSQKEESDADTKKNLIVYLNHPRPDDMSTSRTVKTEGEKYVAAKEFDSQGISKVNKYLDVGDLNDYSEFKSLQDKDKEGLSVVVIGDAYKYKKIVLLISSKAGGLKFIPMVKDNRD